MEKCRHEVLFFMRRYIDDQGVYLKNINECVCLNCNTKVNNPMGKYVMGIKYLVPGITCNNTYDDFLTCKEEYMKYKNQQYSNDEIVKFMNESKENERVKTKRV